MQAAKRVETALSPQPKPPSVSSEDLQYYVSVGMIISARPVDVDRIRAAVTASGGKIVFSTVTPAPIYVLRHYEVEKILRGDLGDLVAIHERKSRERREKV